MFVTWSDRIKQLERRRPSQGYDCSQGLMRLCVRQVVLAGNMIAVFVLEVAIKDGTKHLERIC